MAIDTATDVEYRAVRDAMIDKITTGVSSRDDEIIIQACHNMLYYHSFGEDLGSVQTKMIELRDFLKDVICNYKGYIEIRPRVVEYVVWLNNYLNSLENPNLPDMPEILP